MTLVQELDARGRSLVIPALAVTGASLDIHSDEAAELLAGLEQLEKALRPVIGAQGDLNIRYACVSRPWLLPLGGPPTR
jgi:hypothetical protein